MFSAIVMALIVRVLLDHFGDLVPSAAVQVVLGAAIGSVIYGALILLTERPLLRKLFELARKRPPVAETSPAE